ncbi:MAG TPA: O-antigen ligase family protein [Stellaceae bacterium]|nr:O-antigen ligase family protein [Stellaceae bacterium]
MQPSARSAFELGLDICAFLFLPVLVLASRGAAPLIGVAGVCALGVVAPNGAAAWQQVRGWALLFAMLVLFGAASSLWAVNPWRSLLIALRLTGLFVAGLSLAAASGRITAPRRLITFFISGLLAAMTLAVVQYATDGALTAAHSRREFAVTMLNQAETGFALLLLPLSTMLVLRRHYLAAALLAALTIAVIWLLVGDMAKLAVIIGGGGAAGFYWRRRALARTAAVLSVVLVAIAPLTLPRLADIDAAREAAEYIKFSAWHRLEIWSFAGSRIAEKPLLGWGLDSSRAIPGGNAMTPEDRPWLPLHPHNAALQVWLELGIGGAALLAALLARVWLALGNVAWPRLYAAAAGGCAAATLVVALGSYGIWQEWLLASEFLTVFLVLVMARLTWPAPDAPR